MCDKLRLRMLEWHMVAGRLVLRMEFKLDLDNQTKQLNELIKKVEKDLKDLKAEFATDMVSKKDFNRLKSEVLDIKEELERLKTKSRLTN